MIAVQVACPLPFVIKTLKRVRELGGHEDIWPYGQAQPDRHMMRFVFVDADNGDTFYREVYEMLSRWEKENGIE